MKTQLKMTLCACTLAVASAAGCASRVSDTDEPVGDLGAELGIDQHEAQLIFQLVNSPSTTLATLDDDAKLNARAARSIINHRNGPDGLYPSADDDPIESLEELEAVKFVGPSAVLDLLSYAVATAPVSGELVEGVEFNSDQVEAVVWGVNRASVTELDEVVGLSPRASDNLVELAPFHDVAGIGAVPYVGPAALEALRSYTIVWRDEMNETAPSQAGTYDGVPFDGATARTALALANTASWEQLTGEGHVWSGGATRIVEGRPYATLAQVASTYGIGRTTMQQLKDYASSGAQAQQGF